MNAAGAAEGVRRPWCDRKFYPSRSDALYCGDTCRQQAHRERKAGALAVTPPSVTGKSPVTAVTDKRPVTDSPPSAVTPAPRTPVTPGPRPRGIDALLAELGPLVAELERHTDSGDLSDSRRLRDHPFADGAH